MQRRGRKDDKKTKTRACKQTRVHTYTPAHMHACLYAYMRRASADACIRTCIHAGMCGEPKPV